MQMGTPSAASPVSRRDHFDFSVSPTSHSEFLALLGRLELSFGSNDAFNSLCRRLVDEGANLPVVLNMQSSSRFSELLARISPADPQTIVTGWGGVVVHTYEHPNVNKHLVVRAGGYLAFEKHEQKSETLVVESGAGILLYRDPSGSLLARSLLPGDRISFAPGFEHCVIACNDLLILENSVDPKGMDQDLIFLFTPD